MIKNKKWVELDIEKLVTASWNYKLDDIDLAKKLENNIKRNGQVENILVRELESGFYEVINGNHRITAFTSLEMKKVVCYNFGKISDAQARRIAVETNETKFETDNIKLAELIKEISGDDEFTIGELAETMPYSTDELKAFGEMLDFDWGQFDGSGEEGGEGEGGGGSGEEPVVIVCPHCGKEIPIPKK